MGLWVCVCLFVFVCLGLCAFVSPTMLCNYFCCRVLDFLDEPPGGGGNLRPHFMHSDACGSLT